MRSLRATAQVQQFERGEIQEGQLKEVENPENGGTVSLFVTPDRMYVIHA